MQTPHNLNNQQAWGGQRFRNYSQEPSTGQEQQQFSLSPQPGFIASHSDDLF